MITQATAREIFACNTEIKNSIELLADIKSVMEKNNGELSYPSGWDGKSKNYCELRVPTNSHSSRLFMLNGQTAIQAIERHINDMRLRLVELNAKAKEEIEMGGNEDHQAIPEREQNS